MSIVDNRLSVINCQLSVIMQRYVFIAALYAVSFSALSPAHAQSPYISRVWEYCPAPGQFVNELPEYEDGDDADSMCRKAGEYICGTTRSDITLGGWGGYVVVGFDHMIVNLAGEYDFRIWGNAFYADVNHPENGGSSEPGIISVSYDANGNGQPDDKWYEIAGSEYSRSTRNYEITYFRTPADHVKTPKMSEDLVDTTYIKWRDKNGTTGYLAKNRYHSQDYYPQWVTADKVTYSGTLLPDNAVPYKETGQTRYIMSNYAYGYADNHPNDNDGSKIKIDWAVDKKGNAVNLPGIHFVKIQTGVNQQCGWIGELSTEVSGGEDLHPDVTTDIEIVESRKSKVECFKILKDGHIYIIINDQIKYVL